VGCGLPSVKKIPEKEVKEREEGELKTSKTPKKLDLTFYSRQLF
jgi:hypothetical protein